MKEEMKKEKCSRCGKYRLVFDYFTPFGCQGEEGLEPLDREFICKRCFPVIKRNWIKRFKNGERSGDWEKSRAEREAAKEMGLVWVGSSGVGVLGTRYFLEPYHYYPKKLYDRMSKLPYYGWCMVCGAENKGGYCSDDNCKNSFKQKTNL